jgi:hypothetical protein
MKVRARHCRWAAALLFGIALVARAGAQDADSSPFLPNPAAGGAAGAAAENEPLELHGIMPTADGLRFCIFDAAKKTSRWVGLNDAAGGAPYVVKSADPDRDTVTVLNGGRLMTLSLRKPKVQSFAAGNPAILGALPPGVSTVLNPTPADEQRRLQAIAAEVRRRRLAREAADRMEQQGPR